MGAISRFISLVKNRSTSSYHQTLRPPTRHPTQIVGVSAKWGLHFEEATQVEKSHHLPSADEQALVFLDSLCTELARRLQDSRMYGVDMHLEIISRNFDPQCYWRRVGHNAYIAHGLTSTCDVATNSKDDIRRVAYELLQKNDGRVENIVGLGISFYSFAPGGVRNSVHEPSQLHQTHISGSIFQEQPSKIAEYLPWNQQQNNDQQPSKTANYLPWNQSENSDQGYDDSKLTKDDLLEIYDPDEIDWSNPTIFSLPINHALWEGISKIKSTEMPSDPFAVDWRRPDLVPIIDQRSLDICIICSVVAYKRYVDVYTLGGTSQHTKETEKIIEDVISSGCEEKDAESIDMYNDTQILSSLTCLPFVKTRYTPSILRDLLKKGPVMMGFKQGYRYIDLHYDDPFYDGWMQRDMDRFHALSNHFQQTIIETAEDVEQLKFDEIPLGHAILVLGFIGDWIITQNSHGLHYGVAGYSYIHMDSLGLMSGRTILTYSSYFFDRSHCLQPKWNDEALELDALIMSAGVHYRE